MEEYGIQKFSDLIKVSTATLRKWDKNGKLKPYRVAQSGYRYYSREQLIQLKGGVELLGANGEIEKDFIRIAVDFSDTKNCKKVAQFLRSLADLLDN